MSWSRQPIQKSDSSAEYIGPPLSSNDSKSRLDTFADKNGDKNYHTPPILTGELEDADDGWEVIDKRQAPRVPRTKKHQEPVMQTQNTSWYDWYNSLIYPTPMPAKSS